MSYDRREFIIVALVDLSKGIEGVKSVSRNRVQVSAAQRPAVVVLDGDEEGALGSFALGRPGAAPGIMRMRPEVCVLTSGNALGTDLNTFRLKMINAVLENDDLAGIVTQTGGVQYQGCTTDLGQGRTMEGMMILHFEIHYPLLAAEL